MPRDKFEPVRRSRDWWDVNMKDPKRLKGLHENTGGASDPQRVAFRSFLTDGVYGSILDCGAGPGWEYDALRQNGFVNIRYVGLEVTEIFAKALEDKGVEVVRAGIEKIPMPDQSFDISYTRHVLEHIESLEKAISEMIRVARRHVYICMNWDFGIHTKKDPRGGLIRTHWSEQDLRLFLSRSERVVNARHNKKLKTWVIDLK